MSNLLTNRQFWVCYLGAGTDYSCLPNLKAEYRAIDLRSFHPRTVKIDFQNRYSLIITTNIDGHDLQLLDLENGYSTRIGWMDSHQMSDVFRFEELLDICMASTMRPIWQVKVLLSHYVAPTPDIIDNLVSTLRDALKESNLFTETESNEIAGYMQKIVRKNFLWSEDPTLGWIGIMDSDYSYKFPYTARTKGEKDFNFTLFNAFLLHCRKVNQQIDAS